MEFVFPKEGICGQGRVPKLPKCLYYNMGVADDAEYVEDGRDSEKRAGERSLEG